MKSDQVFELHTYPSVVHAFDNARQAQLVLKEGHPMLYNQDVAEDSYRVVHTFLDRYLRSSSA